MTEIVAYNFLDQKTHTELEALIKETKSEELKTFLLDRCAKILANFGQPCNYYGENSMAESSSVNIHITELSHIKDIIFSSDFENVIEDIYLSINPEHKVFEEFKQNGACKIEHTKEFSLFFCLFYGKMNCWYYGDNSGTVADYLSGPVYGDYTTLKSKIRDLQTLLQIGYIPDDLDRYYEFLEKCNGDAIKDEATKLNQNMFG